ncbi:MAG TPA: fimbria/pilus periplasmic chaperone, partial [Candidatus Elarobacter sp.]|nr:fimbria/pilus periplasmic chaperone [Candidatus Elarobacter sp.]
MQLRHTSPALAVAMLLLALPASALDTHVTPLVVNLPAGTTSQTITVQNMATSTLRIQVVAYKWTQDADSPEKLQPTDELVFFPSLLSIDPGGTRAVRVGLQNPSRSPLERTYRVMFRELPSLENAFAPNSATIKVQMQLSIPVYVEPLKPAPKPLLESVAVHGGKLSFRLSNPGNTHFKVLSLAVAG